MELILTECEATDSTGLFEDLIKFKTVDKYLEAIVNNWEKRDDDKIEHSNFFITYCVVIVDGESYGTVINGEVTKDAKKIIQKVKKLKKSKRTLINDRIKIKADSFEGDLVFYLS